MLNAPAAPAQLGEPPPDRATQHHERRQGRERTDRPGGGSGEERPGLGERLTDLAAAAFASGRGELHDQALRLDAPTLLRRVLAGGQQLRIEFGQLRRQVDETPG